LQLSTIVEVDSKKEQGLMNMLEKIWCAPLLCVHFLMVLVLGFPGCAFADISIVSRANTAALFGANGTSSTPFEISSDNRYAVFISGAGNLISGDNNRVQDVFVIDSQTNILTRASVSTSGAEANDASIGYASISADARYVAFSSLANNLVASDTNAAEDIFVRDRIANTTNRINRSVSLGEANGRSYSVDLSGNGRYACFLSLASNLVVGDSNGVADVFRADLQAAGGNGIVRVSLTSTGAEGVSEATRCAISDDGARVVFQTSDDLTGTDSDGQSDVYLRDFTTSSTTVLSNTATANFEAVTMPQGRAISGNGLAVIFSTRAALLGIDTNSFDDVYRRSLADQSLTLISVSSAGTVSSGSSSATNAAINGDGSQVLFSSNATNLVSGTPAVATSYLRNTSGVPSTLWVGRTDNSTGINERVLAGAISRDAGVVGFRRDAYLGSALPTPWLRNLSSGIAANAAPSSTSALGADAGVRNSITDGPSASRDGRFIVYTSDSSNLVAGDTNSDSDVFLFDRSTNGTRRISLGAGGEQVFCASIAGSISGDGRYALVLSCGNLLTNGAATARFGLYRIDLQTNARVLVNQNLSGVVSVGSYRDSDISDDGNWIAFAQSTDNSDIVSPSPSGLQVYLRNVSAGTTVLASRAPSGLPNGESQSVALKGDGQGLSFLSTSTNLVASDTNSAIDAFYFDLASNAVSRVSVTDTGTEADQGVISVGLSADGRFVAFGSSSILVGGSTQGVQVYLRDRQLNRTLLISRQSGSNSTLLTGINTLPAISDDGRIVVFQSNTTDVPWNPLGDRMTLRFDRTTEQLTQVSRPRFGTLQNGDSFGATIRGDGRYIVFDATAANLAPGDGNGEIVDTFIADIERVFTDGFE
jgi:Tol biopolymer transport system component